MADNRCTDAINQLIAVCVDAEGYCSYAAGKVVGSQLHPLLCATAGLHREVGDALRPYVGDTGVLPRDGGTLGGKLHQLKGAIRATFAADPETALLLELQDIEQEVVQTFEGALAKPMDPSTRKLVAGRLAILTATQDRIADIVERAAV